MCNISAAASRVKLDTDEPIYISRTTNSMALLPCHLVILPILLPFIWSSDFLLAQQNMLWLKQLLIRRPPLRCLPPPTPAAQQRSFPTALACVWQGASKRWISATLQARTSCLVGLPLHKNLDKGSVSQAATLPQKPSPARDPHTYAPPVTPIHGLPLPSQTLAHGASDTGRLEKLKHPPEAALHFHSHFCRPCDAQHCKPLGCIYLVNTRGK